MNFKIVANYTKKKHLTQYFFVSFDSCKFPNLMQPSVGKSESFNNQLCLHDAATKKNINS